MESPEERDGDEDETVAELLAQLIQALGAGARAVQELPSDRDELQYQATFPEFSSALRETSQELLDSLLLALDEDGAVLSSTTELDDPLLWETCADACDALVEQAETHLRNSGTVTDLAQVVRQKAHSSFGKLVSGIVDMQKPQLTYRLYHNLPYDFQRTTPFVPPIRHKFHAIAPLDLSLRPGHGIHTRFGTLNSRHNTTAPSHSASASTSNNNENLVAPSHHVPHVYETEIRQLQYAPSHLRALDDKPNSLVPHSSPLRATWIDNVDALQHLVDTILDQHITELAIDLEAHSFRSFQGLVCLMQLSYRYNHDDNTSNYNDDDNVGTAIQNHLIDPFPIWNEMGTILGPVFANPDIVKVMHGADSDVQWLQRDFGLYVVNLFDTGRAARALKFPSAGYAYLLQHYVGITADKSHQLSDWRQRPLPEDMKQYAIMDTHYLVDIYQHLKYDLNKATNTTIKDVFDISKQVSLIRYTTEPFRPNRYQTLMKSRRGKRVQSDLSAKQERVLKALFDWRDQAARDSDESLWYVCRNDALLRMAMACPTNLSTLQGLFHPMPPLVLMYAKDIVNIVQSASAATGTEKQPSSGGGSTTKKSGAASNSPVGAPASAFSKPSSLSIVTNNNNNKSNISAATSHRSSDKNASESTRVERNLMSPVLGTEALYKQAGWITPNFQVVEPISTTEDDEDNGDSINGQGQSVVKPTRALGVHPANQSYRSQTGSAHSLQMGGNALSEGNRVASGLGSVRAAAASDSRSQNNTPSMDDDSDLAQARATQIRTTMSQDADMMGLINTPGELVDEDEQERLQRAVTSGPSGETDKPEEEEFVIPRSMREIYRISNRNRKNKKSVERTGTPATEKEMKALAEAEEVLKARGLDTKAYFDDIPGSPKRQRTKSVGNASQSSEEAGGGSGENASQSREDDIQLMQDIGWVKDKAEVEAMLKRRPSVGTNDGGNDDVEDEANNNSGSSAGKSGVGSSSKTIFDYSSVGQIGAFQSTQQAANPFFSGAATTGGHLAQQFGKSSGKKKQSSSSKKPGRRGGQVERPEKQDGKVQAFRKR